MPRAIIISACDTRYSRLAADLFNSLRALRFDVDFDLGLYDVGLTDSERTAFERAGIKVVTPGYDIPLPEPVLAALGDTYRAMTARPRLPHYFPGYDVYMWMDADTWAQTPEGINTMLAAAAKSHAIQICIEVDRCYHELYDGGTMWGKYSLWYNEFFPPEIARTMGLRPMFNCGLFALQAGSPVWQNWFGIMAPALQSASTKTWELFMIEQLSLNIALYRDVTSRVVMPTCYNWATALALPMLDRTTNLLVEPAPPYRPISHFHLTRAVKQQVEQIKCTDGSTAEIALTWSARQG